MSYAHREETAVDVNGPPSAVFDYLDDQRRLGGHMEKPSAMMMGGRMAYEFDDQKGRAVGSVIRMQGQFLGLSLSVTEVVTERTPPTRKTWETQGEQKLIIMHAYRMGFDVAALGNRSRLRVFIDYSLPPTWSGRVFGLLFAPAYARWCIKRMARDAKARFGAAAPRSAAQGPAALTSSVRP